MNAFTIYHTSVSCSVIAHIVIRATWMIYGIELCDFQMTFTANRN